MRINVMFCFLMNKCLVNIGTAQIENTRNEKFLGIIIDPKLSFDKHIQQICSRASAKLRL